MNGTRHMVERIEGEDNVFELWAGASEGLPPPAMRRVPSGPVKTPPSAIDAALARARGPKPRAPKEAAPEKRTNKRVACTFCGSTEHKADVHEYEIARLRGESDDDFFARKFRLLYMRDAKQEKPHMCSVCGRIGHNARRHAPKRDDGKRSRQTLREDIVPEVKP